MTAREASSALVVLVVILALGLVPERVSAPTAHAPIRINADYAFTSASGVVSGSGTPQDPYVIAGWDIDATNVNGIDISGTRAHFVIRNVFVHSGGDASQAISLSEVENGRIEASTISGNKGGIVLDLARNVSLVGNRIENNGMGQAVRAVPHGIAVFRSDNITIEGNFFKDDWQAAVWVAGFSTDVRIRRNDIVCYPDWIGIQVAQSSRFVEVVGNTVRGGTEGIAAILYSVGVAVYHNNLVDNARQGMDEAGPENRWDDGYPSGGNYWSDYTGVDLKRGPNQDQPGGDGIGDTPYVIDADSQDRYPLMSFVPDPPDYAVFDPSPPSPVTVGLSAAVTFSLAVANLGGDAHVATVLEVENGSSPGSPFATFPVPPLSAGGNAGPFAAPWVSPANPGTYTVTAVVDANRALRESFTANNDASWTVHVVPGPLTTLVVGQPNVPATETYVTSATPLSFSVLDQSGTGIRNTTYRVDGGPPVNYTEEGPFALAGEGEHLLEWHSEDFVGNVEAVANATLVVDDTPPTTTPTIGAPAYIATDTFVTSSSTLTLAAMDGGVAPVGLGGVEYRIDGGAWTSYATPLTLAPPGRHAIEYRATDRLGNTETPRNLTLVVDDAPPVTTITIGAPKSLVGGTFVTATTPLALAATDGGVAPVGVSSTSYRIWSGTWSAWTLYASPFGLSGPDGVRYVEYGSADFLGNTEAPRNTTIVVDNTPPTTAIAPASGPYTTATEFTLAAMDAGSGVDRKEYRVDGGAWTPYADGFTLSAGDHRIGYRSADRLDNTEAEKTLAVTVTSSPPPTPPSSAETNWKPLVAAVFAAILALVGAWSSRRAPWPAGTRRRLRAFLLTALPFVAAEVGTGVVSFFTGLLAIPSPVPVGIVVDSGILVAGIAALTYRALKRTPSTGEVEV